MKGMKTGICAVATLAIICGLLLPPGMTIASSHMDAPLITLDPAANTTDVYAFVGARDGAKYLNVALAVYPHEEPGVGPNKYNFDNSVLYEIHVATKDSLTAGTPTLSYQFRFVTAYKSTATILQSYVGVVQDTGDANQNLTQTYTVTLIDRSSGKGKGVATILGTGTVPPNNQGNATPFYNQGDNGENAAKEGVSSTGALDKYTAQTIASLGNGHRAFAGQRDDGFYGDIQAIFDLLKLRKVGQDSQGGFNLHMMALEIPVAQLGGDQQIVGVYATTSRQAVKFSAKGPPKPSGKFVQVGRQGNPLFNEGLVAIVDKDAYNRTSPATDALLFKKYAETPELAKLINLLVFNGAGPAPETGRSDIAGIFIPDLIKVDLSTEAARLAGNGTGAATNPDDAGFSRLSIFGGDTLVSKVQSGFGNGTVPGGWPNGRRFGDDVVDIAVTALISDLRTSPPTINGPAGDGVDKNDIGYNKVFPYAATPLNGRTHRHP